MGRGTLQALKEVGFG